MRQWVQTWRDDPRVKANDSHRLITGTRICPALARCQVLTVRARAATLQELGDFYLSKGQRATPSPELVSSLRSKLQARGRVALP